MQLVFDSPVHANGGLKFDNPFEICPIEPSRGGGGDGKSRRRRALEEQRRRAKHEEEALLAQGLTLILMELI